MNETAAPIRDSLAAKPNSLLITLVAAVCLFILDAVVLHVTGFAMYAALVAVFWLIPSSLYSLIKGRRDIGLFRLKKGIVYLVTALAVVVAFTLNNRLAEHRAAGVITAITKFHDQKGHYPNSLKDLAPEYLENVPIANLTLTGSFIYLPETDAPSLGYYVWYPFAKRYYNFKRRGWTVID